MLRQFPRLGEARGVGLRPAAPRPTLAAARRCVCAPGPRSAPAFDPPVDASKILQVYAASNFYDTFYCVGYVKANYVASDPATDVSLGSSIKDVDTLQRVHALKTGALIRAAVLMGGMAGEATDAERAVLSEYGAKVGLAFQLADDVLDADQDDKPNGPPSYVKLLGVPETRRRARAVADEAIAAVKKLPFPKTLIELANYTVQRDV